MTYLISFLPWIAYGVLADVAGWVPALAAALLIAVAATVFQRRSGQPLDVLTVGGLVFFAGLLAASPWLVGTALTGWTQTASHGVMALLMWLSIAIRAPFTLVFAREQAPADVVGTPRFLRLNDIISGMWAVSFTVSTAALVVVTARGLDSTPVTVAIIAASVAVPVIAMQRYIAAVTARYVAEGTAAATEVHTPSAAEVDARGAVAA